ncbi:hypothetical protein [Butyrivibrio sp. FC2001]|uniref:hypothetical protein n=1 Tax=Butyrivibrio sp. FC2001 TaxID=1280671 RepID=UPI00047972BE|nr:hypothetical protein [Butyrivibrio sp. FC2001]
MNNISIDVLTNTIIITKAFYYESMKFGTEEEKILHDIMEKYPNMRIALRSNRRSHSSNSSKGLTYDYMRRFIRTMDRENIIVFEDVINHYEAFGYSSGQLYQCVKNWFLDTYPHHKDMIVDSTPHKKIA